MKLLADFKAEKYEEIGKEFGDLIVQLLYKTYQFNPQDVYNLVKGLLVGL